jgi:hypothetical protein
VGGFLPTPTCPFKDNIAFKIPIKFRVKDLFCTCDLKALFFGTSVSIRIADGIWVLQKDRYGTSVYFSVQNLTNCHMSTIKC